MKESQYHSPQRLVPGFRPSPLSRLLILVVYAALLVLVALPTFANPDPPPLRIGLVGYLKGVSTVDISCSVDFTVTNSKRDVIAESTYLEPINIYAKHDGIEMKKADGKTIRATDMVRVAPRRPNGLLTVSAPTRSFSQYRGALEIRRIKDNGLLLVNEVSLEDYLLGVLPAEMPYRFQPEALKAQAVAARTYAEKTRKKHVASGFDLCDTVHCQVYLGSAGEKQQTTKAVMETTGMVAKHKGELIWAQYCADCGGRTQNGDDPSINHNVPYLRSISDSAAPDEPDFCSTNKSHEWSKKYTPQELEAALNKNLKPPLEGLKSVAFCEYDESGRVKRVDLVDSKGARSINGTQLRQMCGYSNLRSTKMIVCAAEDGSICFEGKGWGHGVGLCQWGAEGLAREPYKMSFEQILKHYYAGIQIDKLR